MSEFKNLDSHGKRESTISLPSNTGTNRTPTLVPSPDCSKIDLC